MMVMIRDWTLFEDVLSCWSVSSDSISIQKDEIGHFKILIVFMSNIFAVFYLSGKKSGKAKKRHLEEMERLSGCGSSQKSARPEAPVLPPIKPERIIVTRKCDVPLVILPDGLLMQFTDYSGVTAGTVLKRVEPHIQLASSGRIICRVVSMKGDGVVCEKHKLDCNRPYRIRVAKDGGHSIFEGTLERFIYEDKWMLMALNKDSSVRDVKKLLSKEKPLKGGQEWIVTRRSKECPNDMKWMSQPSICQESRLANFLCTSWEKVSK